MTFKFIHMADVHLDTVFASKEQWLRKYLRDSLRQAFRAGVELALTEQVDAVLVAGDLFDNHTLSFATEKFLIDELLKLKEADIPVFYAPGNHDPYDASLSLGRINWPANVHVFDSREPTTITVHNQQGDSQAVIVGAAHLNQREGSNLASQFPVAENGIPHIGLLHCLVTGSSGSDTHDRYAPCSIDDLCRVGYNYWALGHVHTRSVLHSEPNIVYPGNIMGRHPRENGDRGVYVVTCNGANTDVKFKPLSPVCWLNFEIGDLADCSNYADLEQKLIESIEEHLTASNHIGRPLIRASLAGPCSLLSELQNDDDLDSLVEGVQTALNLEYLEILTDSLVMPVQPDKYVDQLHVLSTALRLIKEMRDDDELLLKVKPADLAGMTRGNKEATVAYLRSLLNGLEYEATASLIKDGADEI